MGLTETPVGMSYISNKVFDRDNSAIRVSGEEAESIKNASDMIKTINWTDATKSEISTIVYVSVSLGKTLTEAFNDTGETTTIISRTVA